MTCEYAKPDVLVETEWLEERADDPTIRVVEVDEDTEAYDKGHLRGAVRWNWTADLHAEVGRDYIGQDELSDLLSRSGVGPDTTVVLYAGNNNWFATYAYWVLKLRGFDNVKLLNGGRTKWERESRELTQEPAYPRRVPDQGSERRRSGRSATRCSRRWAVAPGSSMFARPRSTEGRRSPRTTCRRSRPRSPVTSPAPPISPGPRRPTRMARSRAPMS